jgi:uncharacterized protein (DUF433 family)
MTRQLAPRITVDPAVCHGEACVAGTRVMVSVLLDCLADGMSAAEVLVEYPGLTTEDVTAALAYAASVIRVDQELPLEAQAG